MGATRTLGYLRKLGEEYKERLSEWKLKEQELDTEFKLARAEVLNLLYQDESQAITEIATIDALATLKLPKSVLFDEKHDNDNKIDALLKAKCNLELERTPVEVDQYYNHAGKLQKTYVTDRFHRYLSKDIVSIFENFLFDEIGENDNLDKCLQKLTPEKVDAKVAAVLEQFFAAFCKEHAAKKTELLAIKEDFLQLMRNDIFLCAFIKTLIGADNAQKMDGLGEQLAFKRKYNNVKLRKPFIALSFMVATLQIPGDTNERWHELWLYFTGFYERVYRLIPDKHKDAKGEVIKSKDGYPIVDKQDGKMHYHFWPISKYDIALLYKAMAEKLKPKLKPRNEITRLYKVENKQDWRLIERHCVEEFIPENLRAYLQQAQKVGIKLTPADKLNKLRSYVELNVPFTWNQVLMLQYLQGRIVWIREEYKKKKPKDGAWSNFFHKGWEASHSQMAKRLVTDASDQDPQEQLRLLYKAWDQAVADKSTTMKPLIEKVLLEVFENFVRGIPQPKIEKAPTQRR